MFWCGMLWCVVARRVVAWHAVANFHANTKLGINICKKDGAFYCQMIQTLGFTYDAKHLSHVLGKVIWRSTCSSLKRRDSHLCRV